MDASTTTPPKRKERNFEKTHEVERLDMRTSAAPFRLQPEFAAIPTASAAAPPAAPLHLYGAAPAPSAAPSVREVVGGAKWREVTTTAPQPVTDALRSQAAATPPVPRAANDPTSGSQPIALPALSTPAPPPSLGGAQPSRPYRPRRPSTVSSGVTASGVGSGAPVAQEAQAPAPASFDQVVADFHTAVVTASTATELTNTTAKSSWLTSQWKRAGTLVQAASSLSSSSSQQPVAQTGVFFSGEMRDGRLSASMWLGGSTEEEKRVRRIDQYLKAHGFETYGLRTGPAGGASDGDEIAGLERCGVVLICLSAAYVEALRKAGTRAAAQFEVALTSHKPRRMLPILLDPNYDEPREWPRALEFALAPVARVNFVEEAHFDDAADELQRRIRKILGEGARAYNGLDGNLVRDALARARAQPGELLREVAPAPPKPAPPKPPPPPEPEPGPPAPAPPKKQCLAELMPALLRCLPACFARCADVPCAVAWMRAAPADAAVQRAACARIGWLLALTAAREARAEAAASCGAALAVCEAMADFPLDALVQRHGADALRGLTAPATSAALAERHQQLHLGGGLALLCVALRSHAGEARACEAALSALWAVLWRRPKHVGALRTYAGLAHAADALKAHIADGGVQEWGLALLWCVAASERVAIVELGGERLAIAAMAAHPAVPGVQEAGCGLLHNLARAKSRAPASSEAWQSRNENLDANDANGGLGDGDEGGPRRAVIAALAVHPYHAGVQQAGCAALCSLATSGAAEAKAIKKDGGVKLMRSALNQHKENDEVVRCARAGIRAMAAQVEPEMDLRRRSHRTPLSYSIN